MSTLTGVKSQVLERQAGKIMTNYPVGDFLIQLKNAKLAGRKEVTVKKTKFIVEIANLLKKEGYLDAVTLIQDIVTVSLRYHKKTPILMNIKLVSKPGLRIYMSTKELRKVRGAATYIISTPKGLMTTQNALKNSLGGEVIAEIL